MNQDAKSYVDQAGPLYMESLLTDPATVEIMIDGYQRVLLEQHGQLIEAPTPFQNEEQLLHDIQAIFAPLGQQLTPSTPILDGRLPDGSLVHAVGRPLSPLGPALVIRKFPSSQFSFEELIGFGSMSEDMLAFMRGCVLAHLNLVVAGGTGSGKTTFANALCGLIPPEERVILIEDRPEMRVKHQRLLTLQTRPANLEGRGGVTVSDLLNSAVKMRPDRIIAGDVRGGEVLQMVNAMNTGHEGCIMTMHAASTRDALARLEMMMSTGNPVLPLLAIREQLTTALDVIFYQERMRDGKRRITRISEVIGLQGDVIQTQDIFEFKQTGVEEGKIIGHFTATGLVPRFFPRLRDAYKELPMNIFAPK